MAVFRNNKEKKEVCNEIAKYFPGIGPKMATWIAREVLDYKMKKNPYWCNRGKNAYSEDICVITKGTCVHMYYKGHIDFSEEPSNPFRIRKIKDAEMTDSQYYTFKDQIVEDLKNNPDSGKPIKLGPQGQEATLVEMIKA